MSAAIQRKVAVGAMQVKDAEQGTARVRFAKPDGVTPDRDREITLADAIPEVQVVFSQFGHTSLTDGTLPAGRAIVHPNGTADVQFLMDTIAGRETFRTLKGLGPIVQYSYGFRVLEEGKLTNEMRDAGAVRVLKRLDVVELSGCVVGAGVDTGTLAIKCTGCGTPHDGACSCQQKVPDAREIMAEYEKTQARLKALFPPKPLSDAEVKKLNEGIAAVSLKYGFRPAEARVDYERHQTALALVAWAASKCGVIPPAVKWFASDAPLGTSADGIYYKGDHTIWLRTDLHGWRLAETAWHELAHAARHARGLSNTEADVEADTHQLLATYAHEVRYGR